MAASLLVLGVLCVAAPALAADVHMFVRHEVADYATWKKSYDAFHATQKKKGVVAQAVYQSVDNPNDVTVTHVFHSLDQAKAFAASPELKERDGEIRRQRNAADLVHDEEYKIAPRA